MGRGAIPEFSFWEGERLGYIDARKRIYIPLYRNAVAETSAFKMLKQKYDAYKQIGKNLYIVDFDAYDHKIEGMSYEDVINDPSRSMGHGFVLGMMLEEQDLVNSF